MLKRAGEFFSSYTFLPIKLYTWKENDLSYPLIKSKLIDEDAGLG